MIVLKSSNTGYRLIHLLGLVVVCAAGKRDCQGVLDPLI